MTDLSINISNNIPAKAAVNASGNDANNHQAEQGFNNLLARQIADSDKPPKTPQAPADAHKQVKEQDTTTSATAATPETVNSQNTDMLATLLAQQNQTTAPQQDDSTPQIQNAQLIQDAQINQNTQLTPNIQQLQPTQVAQNTPVVSNTLTALNSGANQQSELPLENNFAVPESAIKINNRLMDTVKSADLKEFSPVTNNPAQRGSFTNELAASTQQAGFASTLAATAPNNPASIATALSQPAWGDEFSQKITWMATQHNQSAELHLNPPQLGPLDVTLKMNGDQATATFTSPHAAVREAIEQALPKLREMLADSGITLGNAMVSDQSARNNPDQTPGKSPGRSHTASSGQASDASGIQETRIARISRHNGMVDTFA